MSPSRLFLALAALVGGMPAAAATDPPSVRFFRVEARVDLDAAGAVLAVEPLASDNPEAVAKAVAAKVRTLRFTPAEKEGRSATATTYVAMYACAEKSSAGYQMSFRYSGNGPAEGQHVAMSYPVTAERSGVPAHYDALLQVRADGSAVVEELVRQEKGKRYDADFRRVISQWAQAQRFLPETVDGVPVATRVRTRIDFVLTSNGRPQDPMAGSKDCATAFQRADEVYGKDEPIDSPVKISP